MIAAISPVTYWLGFPLWLTLSAASDLRTRQRRLSRTATLDGNSVFTDGGFSESDRILTLAVLNMTREQANTLSEIAAYPQVMISIDEGLFLCRIKSHLLSGGKEATVTAWVESRIA